MVPSAASTRRRTLIGPLGGSPRLSQPQRQHRIPGRVRILRVSSVIRVSVSVVTVLIIDRDVACGRAECELAVPEGLAGSVGYLRGPGLRLAGQDVADWAVGVHDGRVPRTAIGLADQRGAPTGQQCAVRASDELVRRETVRSHPERATGTDHRVQYEVRGLTLRTRTRMTGATS